MPPNADPAGTAAVEGLDEDLAGLDALEQRVGAGPSRARRIWAVTWPKLAAVALGLAIWQIVVWSGWKEEYLFPGPGKVFGELWDIAADGTLWEALQRTLRRAFTGFAIAVVLGTIVGAAVARVGVLRAAFGSLITGIQTMPSVAWVPWSILLFRLSEGAILFVTVLGAAPAVANGIISGVDQIPPILLRAGRVLGARGLAAFRHVVLPASLPGFVAGLKQGWAFAWRSLMAGEIIVIVAGEPSIGSLLEINRGLSRSAGVMAIMLVILFTGLLVDALIFGLLERAVRRRWGLLDAARAR
ncbi:MAG TPA: ABC transporter permease [Acidimicrobiales bacterium]